MGLVASVKIILSKFMVNEQTVPFQSHPKSPHHEDAPPSEATFLPGVMWEQLPARELELPCHASPRYAPGDTPHSRDGHVTTPAGSRFPSELNSSLFLIEHGMESFFLLCRARR
ncbi:hypothetical protein AVEN_159234-1 [Araneus ventricosus]|uniref:Uncharacterized protein n=1 Tax=Araneus ventricosus TaxID=182803 RepID=A0A4Y2A1J0_ARAVE|nr:hypothetical protein AVEN_159234-1 [Araneus ventricosus]